MNIMKWRYHVILFSIILLSLSIGSLLFNGLRPSIDFTGGSLLEIESQVISNKETSGLRDLVNELFEVSVLQHTQNESVIFRGEFIDNETKIKVVDALRELDPDLVELRFTTIGPTFGREILVKMLVAVAIVSVSILMYVWYQFSEVSFGVSAIIAMFHDTLIVLGAFSLLGYFFGVEIDILFVTALLTTLAFSVHDTIVVFDRIRELRHKHRSVEFVTVVNTAVTETLGRSVNNSVTVMLMLLSLTLLGGDTIRWFVAALFIGVTTGTYSSSFLAAPLVVVWDDIRKMHKQKKMAAKK